MKSFVLIKIVLLSLVFLSSATSPVIPGLSNHEVFVATSPCDAVSRPLLGIPATADCEMIKWNLTLNHEAGTPIPTTYKLNFVYGSPQQGTNGLSKGGTTIDREGRWGIVRGTKANPDAIVYQLNTGTPSGPISFLKVDHRLLHLLDRNKGLAIGNGGWSYTLNRTGEFARKEQPAIQPATLKLTSTNSASPLSVHSSIMARFVGRTPCHGVAQDLDRAVNADCIKAKWDLTLYQDPKTLAPTTYVLKGTFFRERVREGKWTIVRGIKANPEAVVYQLDPDRPQGSLLFLRADDNILYFFDKDRNLRVGNADFSYTLNRTDNAINN